MRYDWLDAYWLKKPGVTKDYKEEWAAWRYLVGGKMLAMRGGDKEEKPIITMKLEPAFGELLRRQYPGTVVPGYYMNKEHWNSLYLEGEELPEEVVRDMADQAYRLLFASLSKKLQKELDPDGVKRAAQ